MTLGLSHFAAVLHVRWRHWLMVELSSKHWLTYMAWKTNAGKRSLYSSINQPAVKTSTPEIFGVEISLKHTLRSMRILCRLI